MVSHPQEHLTVRHSPAGTLKSSSQKGVNHKLKRKEDLRPDFKKEVTQLPGGLGGKALDRQGRKRNFFSAGKGCAEAPGPTESAKEECIRGDADYQ